MTKNKKTKSIAMTALIALLITLFPTPAVAYTPIPIDGVNRLIDIFPGPDSPDLAEDIAGQIGVPNTDYRPLAQSEFDEITTISLPTSDVKYLSGIPYCVNLKNLLLPGNLLTDNSLDVLADVSAVTNLDLSRNQLTSAGLTHLAALPLLRLNLSGNKISATGLSRLPASITNLNLSGNPIGDAGTAAVASGFSNLTTLNLANADITNAGAALLAAMPGRSGLSLDLRNNHIGSQGLTVLSNAGFAGLLLDGQTLNAAEITDGKTPIIHNIIVDPAQIDPATISDNGSYDQSTGKITWPARKTNATFTYGYRLSSWKGTVSVPFTYRAYLYTVTFRDGLGPDKTAVIEDENTVTPPTDPERKGYIFTGWSTEDDGNAKFNFSTPITENITLYAGWTQNVEDSGSEGKGRKSYAVVSILHVRNTDDDTSLRIYFGKVKNAKGYYIYRFDNKSKRFVKVKTLEGSGTTSWVDTKLNRHTLYRYKVLPYTLDGKKRKSMKRSYAVWAVTSSDHKANATKVEINQTRITGKKGDTAKLSATVKTVEERQVLSKNIRWNSSDTKIASVDKNGKVKLLRKGQCYIWAKAHNGVNSRRVTIQVK